MASNTYAIANALKGGMRSVKRQIPDTAETILREFRLVVSEPYPPASSPGEPPHLRTGQYRSGIIAEPRSSSIVIKTKGFANNVGTWTEFGTRKMAARPHWRTRLPEIVLEVVPKDMSAALLRGEVG